MPENYTTGQTWTLIAVLGVLVSGGASLIVTFMNRLIASLEKQGDALNANTRALSEHSARVGEIVLEVRNIVKEQAEFQRDLREVLSRMPAAVADELQRRRHP